jgi:UDP-N-acetylmuramoyl-tripeptide--D-alanyl-D-alanine ligase
VSLAVRALAALFSAEEILEIVEGRLAVGMMHEDAGEICVDTRKLREGQWFLALPGKHFDGHDFLGDAFSAGAIGCIVEERANYAIASSSFPLLAVGDTEEAVSRLARNWRQRINPRVILIVGSGTEAKEIVQHFQNNMHLPGRSVTVLRHAGWHEITNELLALEQTNAKMIIEFSAASVGEVKTVADLVAPNMVVLPADALSQLRIQSSAADLNKSFVSLIDSLEQKLGTVAISDQIQIDLEKQVSKAQISRCIVFGEGNIRVGESADEETTELVRCAQLIRDRQNEASADQQDVLLLTALVSEFLGLA